VIEGCVFHQESVRPRGHGPEDLRDTIKCTFALTLALSRPVLNMSHIFLAGHCGREMPLKASLMNRVACLAEKA